jgi:tetratricopeptide (TPR) repeat protein
MPDSMSNIENHYKQSCNSFKAGEWEQALEELMICLRQNPLKRKYSMLYNRIAAQLIARHYQEAVETLYLQGRFDEAINNYQRVISLRISPRHFRQLIRQARQIQQSIMNLYRQANELLDQEKLTKAKRKAQELLEYTPQWLEPQHLLAKIEQCEQAHDLYHQANSFYRDGKYEDARWLLEQCLELDKNFTGPQLLLHRVKEKLEQQNYQVKDRGIGQAFAQKIDQCLDKTAATAEYDHGLALEESVMLLEEGAEVRHVDEAPPKRPDKQKKQPKGK